MGPGHRTAQLVASRDSQPGDKERAIKLARHAAEKVQDAEAQQDTAILFAVERGARSGPSISSSTRVATSTPARSAASADELTPQGGTVSGLGRNLGSTLTIDDAATAVAAARAADRIVRAAARRAGIGNVEAVVLEVLTVAEHDARLAQHGRL